jgi:hypothetical protein
MSTSITKCFFVSQWNTRKHTNVSKSLKLRIAWVIYRVRQITYRAITKNKQDQVIVTMHASKLKMNTRTKYIGTRTQSLQRKLKIQDYFRRSSKNPTRLSTPDRASPALLLLNRNRYKWRTTCRVCCWGFSRWGGLYRGRRESPPTWQGRFGANGHPAGHPCGRSATPLGLHRLQASDPSLWTDVEMCQPSPGPSQLKPWLAGHGVGLASRPLCPLGLGFDPLGPRVKYTLVVMLILTFGQRHFVIHWNAPIWYLSSWNQINTKIVELC